MGNCINFLNPGLPINTSYPDTLTDYHVKSHTDVIRERYYLLGCFMCFEKDTIHTSSNHDYDTNIVNSYNVSNYD